MSQSQWLRKERRLFSGQTTTLWKSKEEIASLEGCRNSFGGENYTYGGVWQIDKFQSSLQKFSFDHSHLFGI